MPKPIKLLEGIGNGALIRSTAILWANGQHFILLWCIGVCGKRLPVDHLQICISCPCRRTLLYRPMLILACQTGVVDLVDYLDQFVSFLWLLQAVELERYIKSPQFDQCTSPRWLLCVINFSCSKYCWIMQDQSAAFHVDILLFLLVIRQRMRGIIRREMWMNTWQCGCLATMSQIAQFYAPL